MNKSNKEIINSLTKAANLIANKNRYGNSNYIITSEEVSKAIRSWEKDLKTRYRIKKIKKIFNI
jgi:hypothetical protein